MSSELEGLYEQIRSLTGERLTRAICEAVLVGWNSDREMARLKELKENPVAKVFVEERYHPSPDVASIHLTSIFLCQLKRQEEDIRLRKTETPELTASRERNDLKRTPFVRLDDYILETAPSPDVEELPASEIVMVDRLEALRSRRQPAIAHMLWFYFHSNLHCLDQPLGEVCRLVYQGVPLLREREGRYEEVPDTHHDCIFLAKKAEYNETGSGGLTPFGRVPKWAMRYFFAREHIAAHRQFFGNHGHSTRPLAFKALRRALREHIAGQYPIEAPASDIALLASEERTQKSLAAQKRWAPLKAVRSRAVELYRSGKRSGKWKSRADAARKLKPQIMDLARDAGSPLSEDHAFDTIDKWLRDAGPGTD